MINDTWIRNYEIAKEYYLEHGDLNVPSKTKLYSWISAQKYAYRGKRGIYQKSKFHYQNLSELNGRAKEIKNGSGIMNMQKNTI